MSSQTVPDSEILNYLEARYHEKFTVLNREERVLVNPWIKFEIQPAKNPENRFYVYKHLDKRTPDIYDTYVEVSLKNEARKDLKQFIGSYFDKYEVLVKPYVGEVAIRHSSPPSYKEAVKVAKDSASIGIYLILFEDLEDSTAWPKVYSELKRINEFYQNMGYPKMSVTLNFFDHDFFKTRSIANEDFCEEGSHDSCFLIKYMEQERYELSFRTDSSGLPSSVVLKDRLKPVKQTSAH